MKQADDDLFNDPEQLHSQEHIAVPASLLPSVLSRLGLADKSSSSIVDVDEQLAALSHQDVALRVAAVRSLEEQREARTIEPLVAALHDSAWEVRAAAVWALGKFGEQAPRALLVARLNDEHASVRQAASIALEQSHPDALSQIMSEPIVSAAEPGAATVFSEPEPAAPGTEREVEARAKASSSGLLTIPQFATSMKMFLSRVVRGSIAFPVDAQPPFFDEEVSNIPNGKPAARNARRQPVRSKSGRLRPLIQGVLAALLIVGLAISWLAIEHGHRPSQGSATAPLLAYHGHVDGPVPSPATHIVWTPHGTRLVISGDKEVEVVDVATQRIILEVTPTSSTFQPAGAVWALSPDGARLATLSGANTVQVWDAVTGSRLQTYQSQSKSVNSMAWSPDDRSIATGSVDGTVRVWNANTAPETFHSASTVVLNITWSPDGKSIAVGDFDGNMWVWRVD